MPEDFSWSHFLSFEASAQTFLHHITWYHCLRKVPFVFQSIIIQSYDVWFALVIHFLHWCYTWTVLLPANQNRVIFSCVLLDLKKRLRRYYVLNHYLFLDEHCSLLGTGPIFRGRARSYKLRIVVWAWFWAPYVPFPDIFIVWILNVNTANKKVFFRDFRERGAW